MTASTVVRTEAGRPQTVEAPRWNLRLLGGFELTDGLRVHTRLPSRAVVALLARLALWPQRDHAREELADLLWPDADAAIGRRRLRHTLSLLKDVLEPAENGPAPVLQADRHAVRVVRGALRCDVQRFERSAAANEPAVALALYAGELLPGFYEDWICDERRRLANLQEALLARPRATVPGGVGGGAAPSGPTATVTVPVVSASPPVPSALAGAPHRTDRSTLPVFLTRYLGDEAQIAGLAACVAQHRWVTLVGPGGSGKTRLAAELARRWHAGEAPERLRASAAVVEGEGGGGDDDGAQFDRIVFVALVGVADRADVLRALARALHVDAPNPTPDALVARLAGWKMLLVLDNCEQLAGVADGLWLELVAALPSLHLLLTSRRSLGVDAERLVAIAPLGLPPAGASVQAVAAAPAVALFVDRAAAVRAGFDVGPRNHAVLAALAIALEGMPLAIELAASRLRTVAPAEMLERLRAGPRVAGETPGLDLLARSSPRGAADPRHASMLRTIEWSWCRLDAGQREVAGAMAVFAGGCSLSMLEAVAGGGSRVASGLDELVAHSLAHPVRTGLGRGATGAEPASPEAGDRDRDRAGDRDEEAPRFRLYEPVREYAAAQFDPGQTSAWRARHRAWAIDWARALPVTPALPAVRAQAPNLAAALRSAAADDAGADAARLLLALGHVLEDVELPTTALEDAARAVDRCRDVGLRARGDVALAPLLHSAGRKDAALRHAERGLADAPDDPALRARALYALARTRWRGDMQHPERALPLIDRAQALADGGSDAYVLAGLCSLRTFVTQAQGAAPEEGRALQRQALRHWQAFGNRHAENLGRYNLAIHDYWCGDIDRALAELDAIAAEVRVLQDWRRLAVVNDALGTMLHRLRRWPEALRAHLEALELGWRSMAIYNLAYVFWNLPPTLAHLRRPEAALRLMAFAEVFYVAHIGALTDTDRRDLLRVRRLAARQLPARACAEAWAHGRLLTLAEARALALEAGR